jgi:hypothetical protein
VPFKIEIAAPRLNKTTKAFNRARKGTKYAKNPISLYTTTLSLPPHYVRGSKTRERGF